MYTRPYGANKNKKSPKQKKNTLRKETRQLILQAMFIS